MEAAAEGGWVPGGRWRPGGTGGLSGRDGGEDAWMSQMTRRTHPLFSIVDLGRRRGGGGVGGEGGGGGGERSANRAVKVSHWIRNV